MADKKEENKSTTYPSVEEKIKMKVEKEKFHYKEFDDYLFKKKVLPNGQTVEEQQMEDIKNRSWEKKFSIRKNIFRKFDAWLDKKAQEEIDRIEREDSFSITKMGNGKADFWMGFTGQRQSRYSMLSSAGAFVRGSLNFVEGILETPFMLEEPDIFMEELVNTPKALGEMKEEIESGNQNIMGIVATEVSWGFALASLGAAAKRNAAIERSNAQMTDDVVELTERMNKCSPDRSCFLAGTLVATKTGKKAIEEIEEGEEVWCEEESTGEQKLKKVLKRIEKTNDILYHVYIGNQEIHTTEDHSIWLEGEGWKKAEDVHVRDIVRCRTGKPEKVINIWMEKLPEHVKVYNLSVEDVHNYYVSERGVLVHNDCPPNNKVNIQSGTRTRNLIDNMDEIAEDIININKQYSDGFELNNSIKNILNSASYYDDPYNQVAAVTRSITDHAFANGNKRTAFDTLNMLLSDLGLNSKLTDSQKWNLIYDIAEGRLDDVTKIANILK